MLSESDKRYFCKAGIADAIRLRFEPTTDSTHSFEKLRCNICFAMYATEYLIILVSRISKF